MKKNVLKVLFSFALCFLSLNVYAAEPQRPLDIQIIFDHIDELYLSKGQGVKVCEYKDNQDPDQTRYNGVEVYYIFDEMVEGDGYDYPIWVTFFYKDGVATTIHKAFENYSFGNFEGAFSQNNEISYRMDGNRFPSIEDSFVCPPKTWIFPNDGWFDDGAICFGEQSDEECGNAFTEGPFLLSNKDDSIFEIIDKYSMEDVYAEITLEEFSEGDLESIIKSKTLAYISNKYAFGTTYESPAFITNYINTLTEINKEKYEEFTEKMKEEADTAFEAGLIDEETKTEIDEKAEIKAEDIFSAGPVEIKPSPNPDCDGLLGAQMTEVVNNVFSFIRYAGPVLVAVLTIMDFIKAATSGEADDMKKASQKLMKRLVAAALLFFVPLLCQTIFTLTNITVPEHCIK